MDGSLTATTMRGATMVMSSQGISRALTFIGNVLLVRSMKNDAAPLGISSTQFHLLYIAGITFTREGLRRACLRQLPANITDMRTSPELNVAVSIANAFSLLSLSVILPAALAYFIARDDQPGDEYYHYELSLVALGSAFEMLAEPLYIIAQSMQWFRERSLIFTLQSMSRVFSGLAMAAFLEYRLGAFAAGYFIGGLVVFLAYAWLLRAELLRVYFSCSPSFRLDTELGKLAKLTTIQSSWKSLLSEGESLLLLTTVSEAEDRGAFAIAAGLGSIAARLILQPCEEAAFTLFGKLEHTLVLFPVLVRTALVFGAFFACLGVNYTHVLVILLYGSTMLVQNTAQLVSWYCLYIAICALNGITEAFLQAKIDEKETRDFNLWLLACSLLFLALANFWLVPAYGTTGLIAANSLVMCVRSARNLHFALTRLQGLDWRMIFPPWQVCVWFVTSYFVTRHTRNELHVALHVATGIVCGLAALGLVWQYDKQLISTLDLRSVAKRRQE